MTDLNRRGFLTGSLGVACCAAASPLLTPVTVAAAPGENRAAGKSPPAPV